MANAECQDDFFLPDFNDLPGLLQLIIVAVLLAFALVLANVHSLLPFPWERLSIVALMVLLVCLSTAGLLTLLRPWLRSLARSRAAGLSFLAIIGTTAIITALIALIEPELALGDLVLRASIFNVVLRNSLIAGILGGVMLRYFYLTDQLRRNQQAELSSRLQALQSRIRPHFLFNSMNIIASLVHSDPDKAEQAVEDLSSLFRATLREQVDVPLDEELTLCQRYINIETLRLGNRLHVEWRLDNIPDGLRIPLLTLQPLLENAIYHGVEPRQTPSTIRISLSWDGSRLTLIVTNPVPPPPHALRAGNRMALDNIRERMAARYGEQAKLTTSADREVFTTYLSYPYVPDRSKPEETIDESTDL